MSIFKKSPPKPPHLRQVQVEPGPDEYGRRPQVYEHEEIIMSNEYIAMIGHIDNTINGLREEMEDLATHAEALKSALQTRVIELTTLVAREKAVVVDLRAHFQDLQARIDGTRNGDTAGRTAVDETPHEPEAA